MGYDKETRVLTKSGWKHFKDVSIDDFVASIDNQGALEWMHPVEITQQFFNGELECWASKFVNLTISPQQKLWVFDYDKRSSKTRTWKFLKSCDAANAHYTFQKSPLPIEREFHANVVIPGVTVPRGFWNKEYPALTFPSVLFYELLGLWITDGSLCKGRNGSGNRVVISQTKPVVRKRIEELLQILEIHYSVYKNDYRISCPQLFSYLYRNFIVNDDCRKTYYVRIPRQILECASAPELNALLAGIILGDGTPITNGKGYQIFTASQGFAEDLSELALYVGKSLKIRTVAPRLRLFPGQTTPTMCQEQYIASITDMPTTMFSRKSAVKNRKNYDDFLYSIRLPRYHRIIVLREGTQCVCASATDD